MLCGIAMFDSFEARGAVVDSQSSSAAFTTARTCARTRADLPSLRAPTTHHVMLHRQGMKWMMSPKPRGPWVHVKVRGEAYDVMMR